MNKSSVSRKTYEESKKDFPNKVYKYRSWKDLKHQNMIRNREIFFASPKSFKDPLDCKNPIRYDLLKEEDIFKYFHTVSRLELNPYFDDLQHLEYAQEWSRKTNIRDPKEIKNLEKESAEKTDNHQGVLSVAHHETISGMWNDYSDSGMGFCVGFDPKEMFKYCGGGGKVDYYDVLPTIMPYPTMDRDAQIQLNLMSKERKWEYEDEYRLTKINYPGLLTNELRTVALPPEAFTEIIFGHNMPEDERNEIRAIAKITMPNVKFRESVLDCSGQITIRNI